MTLGTFPLAAPRSQVAAQRPPGVDPAFSRTGHASVPEAARTPTRLLHSAAPDARLLERHPPRPRRRDDGHGHVELLDAAGKVSLEPLRGSLRQRGDDQEEQMANQLGTD